MAIWFVFGLGIILAGCGETGTGGVVPIGPDMYMLGREGGMFEYSGSGIKAHLYGEAATFCRQQGRVMHPLNSTAQDYSGIAFTSAEIQFKCLKPGEAP